MQAGLSVFVSAECTRAQASKCTPGVSTPGTPASNAKLPSPADPPLNLLQCDQCQKIWERGKPTPKVMIIKPQKLVATTCQSQ